MAPTRVAVGLGVLVMAAVARYPGLGLLALLVAGWWPIGSRRRQRRAHRGELQRRRSSAAGTIELVTMVMAVHASPVRMSHVMADVGPAAMRGAWSQVLHRYRLGTPFAIALDELTQFGGEVYRPLVGLLRHADREGIPVALLLGRLGDEARRRRRHERERRVRALSVQLLLPLVVCALPAVVLGSVVPLAWVALRSL